MEVEVNLNPDEMGLTFAQSKPSYGASSLSERACRLAVHLSVIAQVKRKSGIVERVNYNLPKPQDSSVSQCPPQKGKAITQWQPSGANIQLH